MLAHSAFSQWLQVSGNVVDSSYSPIPGAEIYIKNGQKIADCDNLGHYTARLLAGQYQMVFSHPQYQNFVLSLVISKNFDTFNVVLEAAPTSMEAVYIYSRKVDWGAYYMQKAIQKRNFWQEKMPNHSVELYIKAFEDNYGKKKTETPAKEELDPEVAERKKQEEYQKQFLRDKSLAELIIKKDVAKPNKQKEEVLAIKKVGYTAGLFYLSTLDGDFNFYNNLVEVPAVNKLPVLSPLANTALLAYKFTFLGSYYLHGQRILRIGVKPRITANSVFEGELELIDTSFALHKVQLFFPKSQLNEYSSFKIDQQYTYLPDSQWVIYNQRFDYVTKAGKAVYVGYTDVQYKNYEINKQFAPKYFNRQLSKTTLEAFQKDTSFWNQNRAVQLNPLENKFIQTKDSIKLAHSSETYLDSIEKKRNKVNFATLFLDGQEYHNRRKGIDLGFMPLAFVWQPWWPGGTRFTVNNSIRKEYSSKRYFRFYENLSYGVLNKDIRGTVNLFTYYAPMHLGSFAASVGRDFGLVNPNAAFLDVARRENLYRNTHIDVSHFRELFNGFTIGNSFSVAQRRDISDYKFSKYSISDSIFENNKPLVFENTLATTVSVNLLYTPAQNYILEPRRKVVLGSKWPTFFVNFKAAIPKLFGSNIEFSFLDFGFKQDISFGMLGFSEYNLSMGSFLNSKNLTPIDFKYQRRGDPYIFTNPMYAFQTLDSTFTTFGKYLEGHYRHRFEGALINKIPFARIFKLRESAGVNVLIAPERRNMIFSEVYFGLDKIIRIRRTLFKVGAYYAIGYSNLYTKPIAGLKFNLEFYDRLKNTW